MRSARLGSDETGYRYQPSSRDRPGLAEMPPAAPRDLEASRPRRAAAGGMPDQSLRRECEDGPASGPRRAGTRRAGPVGVARRFGALPPRRPRARRPHPLPQAPVRRRDRIRRARPARLSRNRPDNARLLHPPGRRRADQPDAAAGEPKRIEAYLPLAAGGSPFGAAFGPPLETPTMAGRSTRSPIVQPLWTTWETVPAGTVSSGASNIA